MTNHDVFKAVVEALARHELAALATVVAATGSTPQQVGAKMLVFEDGRTVGTIGGGSSEHDATGRARAAIRSRRPELVRYAMDNAGAAQEGMVCGGQMDVFIEPLAPTPDLYLIGAGHISVEVARLAELVGFRVHVVDDRAAYANPERFPGADVVVDTIQDYLSHTPLPTGSYAVIVTRGHRDDQEALRALVGQDLRYVGMIGSRSKVARIFEALASDGVPGDRLQRVHAPIGLDIGAVSPAEIAVSIVAQLIAVRSGKLVASQSLRE